MKQEQKLNKIKIVVTIIAMVFLIFVITNGTRLLKSTANVFVVENGSLSYDESVDGYVLRDETILKGENYKNGMVQIVSDNQRTAKGEAVFRYYSNGEEEIKSQIEKLDEEINVAIENSNINLFSSDVISLEKQIENTLDSMYSLNDLQKNQENKKKVDEYISKKTQITGTLSEDSYVKSLTSQKVALETELENGSEIIYAPKSGIVSYKMDGLEEILNVENFDYLSTELLDSFNLKVGSAIPQSQECGKIVNNFKCYIATPIATEKALEAKVGDTVYLRFSNSVEVDAKISYIKEEDNGKRIIVFEVTDGVEDLIEYRRISFDIVWWKYSGLKISNSAIIEENEKTYVERNRAGSKEKILVKVLRQNDTYSIVQNYDDDELLNMGYSEEEIQNMNKIKLYDEIILH